MDKGIENLDLPGRDELVARLREAEETLEAIRTGEVDAVVVTGPQGQQVYTLENADRPYRVLVEQMQEGALTLAVNGTILYCNERFAALLGRPRESVVGQIATRFFDETDAQKIRSMIGNSTAPGASGELSLLNHAGTPVPVNVSLIDLQLDAGMPRLVCVIVTDLTVNYARTRELGLANERLAQESVERGKAEASLSLALEAAEMGIWEMDLSEGHLKRSARHDRIFGHDVAEAFDLVALVDHFVPEDRPDVFAAFESGKRDGSVEFEGRIRRADDGRMRWVNIKGQTYYQGTRPIRMAGVTADVTQRRDVDEQLRQAQKMEAVGQLTGGIAHDFNNLLMVIGGSLDMLGRRLAPDPRTDRLLEAARHAVNRGAKLNQQLLAFSRRQDLHAEVLNVNDLIPSFGHLLERAVGETVTVEFDGASDLWICRTDPHQLETAILNLAINARDAMPDGGRLMISTANRRVDGTIAGLPDLAPGDYVVMAVADTGTGMDAETIVHIFEPFFTTKDVGKGTGLGLSQVYGFANQSGGSVEVTSAPGCGTTVAIYLKRSLDVPNASRASSISEVHTGTGVVFVVEDDESVRATTIGMLEDLGYSVVAAGSGMSALDLIRRGVAFDLLFTDVVMPDGMSGVELAREVSVLRPGIPVLLTSGYTARRILPHSTARDLKLLKKPFSQSELSVAVGGMIGTGKLSSTEALPSDP